MKIERTYTASLAIEYTIYLSEQEMNTLLSNNSGGGLLSEIQEKYKAGEVYTIP